MKFNEWMKRVFPKISKLPWKKIIRKIMPPNTAVLTVIVPLAALFLTYMLINGDGGVFSIISYLLSFYALIAVVLRVPDMIAFAKRVKNQNKYLNVYFSDPEARVRVSLYFSFIINTLYAVFQVGLGLVHSSLWYYSLGAYYIILSLLRLFVVRYDRKKESDIMLDRQMLCKLVGSLLILMTVILSFVILNMIVREITIVHHEITTIAMAAYTFTSLTVAIVEVVRHKKTRSLVFMISKAISIVSALVSIITLENAMIAAFGGENTEGFSRIMTAFTGGAICISIILIAIFIINVNKTLQNTLNTSEKSEIEI